MIKTCKNCGNEFDAYTSRHIYCSECKVIMNRERSREYGRKHYNRKPRDPEVKKCKWCGVEFKGDGLFCCEDHKENQEFFYSDRKNKKMHDGYSTNQNSLIDKSKKAREMGISYGQLQAMKFAEGCRVQL